VVGLAGFSIRASVRPPSPQNDCWRVVYEGIKAYDMYRLPVGLFTEAPKVTVPDDRTSASVIVIPLAIIEVHVALVA